MTQITSYICDKCHTEMAYPAIKLQVSTTQYGLDLCSDCYISLTLWLGVHPTIQCTLEQIAEGAYRGMQGVPTAEQAEVVLREAERNEFLDEKREEFYTDK